MADRDVAPAVVSVAKRKMLRRLRSHWRHVQFSIRMALAGATHLSHMRVANAATQTDDEVPVTTCAATAAPAVVVEYVAPASSVTPDEPAD